MSRGRCTRGLLGATAAVAIALLGGLAVAAAFATGVSSGLRLTIKPAVGTPGTRFLIGFTAPASSGRSGSTWRRYEVYANGTRRRDCVWSAAVSVGSARAAQRVRVRLTPTGTARVWCTGRFAGRLEETITPSCPFREVCPAYIATIALEEFSFRVRGRSGTRG